MTPSKILFAQRLQIAEKAVEAYIHDRHVNTVLVQWKLGVWVVTALNAHSLPVTQQRFRSALEATGFMGQMIDTYNQASSDMAAFLRESEA